MTTLTPTTRVIEGPVHAFTELQRATVTDGNPQRIALLDTILLGPKVFYIENEGGQPATLTVSGGPNPARLDALNPITVNLVAGGKVNFVSLKPYRFMELAGACDPPGQTTDITWAFDGQGGV